MINSVVLVGRIGKRPELKYSQNGTPLCKFSLAVNRRGKDDEPDWLNIVCFGKTAEFVAQYMDKGALVGVEGRIQTRQYEKDGQTLTWTEIAANGVQGLESRKEAEARRAGSGQARQAQATEQEPDDFADAEPDPFGDQ
ncbi:MAG: single-stranded DNA-binding protein [Anaerovoracaceae bacterium]|jgi:single-strand DNA-binding protein